MELSLIVTMYNHYVRHPGLRYLQENILLNWVLYIFAVRWNISVIVVNNFRNARPAIIASWTSVSSTIQIDARVF